jgi:hypothetical protein
LTRLLLVDSLPNVVDLCRSLQDDVTI